VRSNAMDCRGTSTERKEGRQAGINDQKGKGNMQKQNQREDRKERKKKYA
jgi:hypothetical protein